MAFHLSFWQSSVSAIVGFRYFIPSIPHIIRTCTYISRYVHVCMFKRACTVNHLRISKLCLLILHVVCVNAYTYQYTSGSFGFRNSHGLHTSFGGFKASDRQILVNCINLLCVCTCTLTHMNNQVNATRTREITGCGDSDESFYTFYMSNYNIHIYICDTVSYLYIPYM